MRTLIALSLLASLPAFADRYWDVEPGVAAKIAAEVEGRVVIEFCSGCGEIFTVFRVDKARVGKGDYSENKQVYIERTVLMSGVSPEPLKLQGSCGKVAAHVDLEEKRLDIPYTWIRRGNRWTWLGKETLSGRPPYIALAPGAAAALAACVSSGQGGVEVKRAGDGWRVDGAEVRLRETSVKVDRRVKGQRAWQRVTGVEIEVRSGGRSVKARAPTQTMSGAPAVVEARKTKHGTAYLVDMGVAGPKNARVLFAPDARGALLAHRVPAALPWEWDEAAARARTPRARFPLVDDLNLRESAPKGKPITRVNRGVVLEVAGEEELHGNRYWRRLKLADGRYGYTLDSLLTPVAPLYDPATGRWLHVSEAEAAQIGVKRAELDKLRDLGDRLEKATTVEKLCAELPAYDQTLGEISGAIGEVWYEASETEPFLDVVARLSREVPGAGFYVFSEGVANERLYSALSPRLTGPGRDAAADVLRAAEALSGQAFPIFLTRTWDLGGCHEPGSILLSLKLLERSWDKTPACLQDALKEGLAGSLRMFASQACFCKSAKRVRPEVKKARATLEKLGALDGPAASKTLGEEMKKAKFSSDCAG